MYYIILYYIVLYYIILYIHTYHYRIYKLTYPPERKPLNMDRIAVKRSCMDDSQVGLIPWPLQKTAITCTVQRYMVCTYSSIVCIMKYIIAYIYILTKDLWHFQCLNHDTPISTMNLMKFINHYQQHSFTFFLGRPVALRFHPFQTRDSSCRMRPQGLKRPGAQYVGYFQVTRPYWYM